MLSELTDNQAYIDALFNDRVGFEASLDPFANRRMNVIEDALSALVIFDVPTEVQTVAPEATSYAKPEPSQSVPAQDLTMQSAEAAVSEAYKENERPSDFEAINDQFARAT